MSANERVKGIQVHRPIIYGSHARLLTEEEKLEAPQGHTHRWTIFLASAATPLPEARTSASSSNDPPPIDVNYIPGGADDPTYLFKRVVFRLHDTYPNPNRMCERPPYQVTETGWGEFTVQIKIMFVPEAGEKALSLQHPIKLHHWGEPIEPIPVGPAVSGAVTGVPTAAGTAEGTPATPGTPAAGGTPAAAITTATVTATARASTGTATPVSSDKLEEVKTEAAGDTPADASVAGTPAGDTTPAAIPAAPLSTASIYPVHAWQYDELVFSDPPANFLAILEEHPPTPLPARNRRPRDQRADHDARTGKKKRKPVTSRAGTATPATPRARTPATAPGTPTAAVAAGTVGIPGEPGSADVPLEYSLEMEKAEYARLTDVRMRIVDQMDRWRERLIAQERDMNRIKEDMKAHAH